jgi:hypothetical protein
MFVCCELSARGLCDGLITCPEESYRLWRVVVRDQETSKTRRLKTANGLGKIQPLWVVTPRKPTTTNNIIALYVMSLFKRTVTPTSRRGWPLHELYKKAVCRGYFTAVYGEYCVRPLLLPTILQQIRYCA